MCKGPKEWGKQGVGMRMGGRAGVLEKVSEKTWKVDGSKPEGSCVPGAGAAGTRSPSAPRVEEVIWFLSP